jgi:hypothetical protein
MLSLLRFAFDLSDISIVKFYNTMHHRQIYKDLHELIDRGDYIGLRSRSKDIIKYIDYEMMNESGDYLTYEIGAHENHGKGRILFQTLKNICRENSQYHWHEIMKVMGRSLMCGSVKSQNIDLLEHAMCHVDEKYLYDLVISDDESAVSRWYEENFLVT